MIYRNVLENESKLHRSMKKKWKKKIMVKKRQKFDSQTSPQAIIT